MTIHSQLNVMMAKRRYSLNELAEAIGITPTNLSILKTDKAKAIRFSTLEGLCRVLECQPGDLLDYIADEKPSEGPSKGPSPGIEPKDTG